MDNPALDSYEIHCLASASKYIQELEIRLEEAESVIAFYADRANWKYSGDDRFDNTLTFKDSSEVVTGKQKDFVGGKRAREYQSKYLNKPEVIQPKEAE